jgi:hypothetical protein
MPRFADVFDTAEGIAIDEQAYELANLISADESRRREIEKAMTGREIARYDALMQRAYSRLALAENTRGRICLD